MEQQIFRKITRPDKSSFRIYVNYEDNLLELVVLEEESCWKSLINGQELSSFASPHQLHEKDYSLQLLGFIRTESPDVSIAFTKGLLTITRTIDKKFKVKFFSNNPEKVNFATETENLLGKFYLQSNNNLERLEILDRKVVELETQNRNYERQINELTRDKTQSNEELYNKFVLVLNEKKFQIQHLTELLQAFKAGRGVVNPPEQVKKGTKSKKKAVAPKATISDSDSSTESYHTDTDEEAKDTNDKNANSVLNLDEPSTSTDCFRFLDDELEDRQQEMILPKRVKYDEKGKSNVVVKKSDPEEIPKRPNEETRSRKEIPPVDFSTQDLLDMI